MVKVALQVYSISMTLAKLEPLVKELFHYLQSTHRGNYLKVVLVDVGHRINGHQESL